MSASTYIEKELEFIFPTGLKWENLDERGKIKPEGMSLVDLVIERENDILLVEIKDPSCSTTSPHERNNCLLRMQNNSLISEDLTPKVRDSYTYLHLMKRDTKPFIYVVLLGLEAYNDNDVIVLLGTFKNRLLRRVKKEIDIPWKREHICDCIVMSVEQWNFYFNEWPVRRLSEVFR